MKANGSPARIVICEDERIVALDIKTFLNRNGYQVLAIYASAEELLAAVESVRPDLVLMDIHLQGHMDGIEAAAILLKRWAIPVILLTAFADSPTIERAKLTHPYAYILKPYDERELKTAISIGMYRAEMERRLRVSEERYRGLFENGITATMLVDGRGMILESNRAFSRLAPGVESISAFLYEEAESDRLAEAMRDGKVYGPSEIRVKQPDGKEVWALLSAAPLELPDGTRAYQCQAVDTTDRKTLMDQLVHAQKLSALGRFAGGVAHDFNNVLTAVMGYARLLRSDFELEGRGLEELDGIEQAARRAAALSRQLLMFSRRDETRITSFKFSDMVRDNERMFKRIAGDAINLVVRIHDESVMVRADRTGLELAVVNLLANARDASPAHGRITISAGLFSCDTETPGEIEPVPAGTWAYIDVSDEGTGMSPETRAKIFQPFFTTKSPESGTGIGLSTVAGIVKQASGRIFITSNPGKGTTMRLLYPSAPAGQTDGETDTSSDSGPALTKSIHFIDRRGLCVLLVEKDDSVRAIMEAMLDRCGFRVVSAGQPGEALLLAEKTHGEADILIVDCQMPLMAGRELAARLREAKPELPVLYLRASESDSCGCEDDPPQDDSAREAFLGKPFTEEELICSIETLLPPGY